ncbi:hypothetical protein CDAR_221811 [Caerostris darwini]|uniref:Uncharacterized protein n=1 Tax=Caerostris darwini TaxID=1538125 RepID=A0AAV4MZT9_9ARAC|nr:hypothetical protein CDAR_221811 [Caerostris darwini]
MADSPHTILLGTLSSPISGYPLKQLLQQSPKHNGAVSWSLIVSGFLKKFCLNTSEAYSKRITLENIPTTFFELQNQLLILFICCWRFKRTDPDMSTIFHYSKAMFETLCILST